MNRSQEAAGGAIEGEALILPGRALTESCQSLHESPDRSRIRFEPFREPESLDNGFALGRNKRIDEASEFATTALPSSFEQRAEEV